MRETFSPASLLTLLASVSPKGEEGWLTFHFHSVNFAQWFLKKVCADCEDGIRVGLVGREGNPCNCSTQTQQGLGKGNQINSSSIQKSNLSCSPLHLFFTLDQEILPSGLWQPGRGPGQERGHREFTEMVEPETLWEFLFCQLHLPRTSPY